MAQSFRKFIQPFSEPRNEMSQCDSCEKQVFPFTRYPKHMLKCEVVSDISLETD